MRFILLTAAAALTLASCGGPKTGQANDAEASTANAIHAPGAGAKVPVATVPMSPVSGDEAKALMHERHEGMEAIGKASKAIHDQLQSSTPDLGTVRSNSAKIADLSQKASGWFHAGTGPDIAKTGARPEIWQNPQDFSAKLGAFQTAAKAFDEAASGTDLNAMNARLEPLGQACKACHDKYRSKMHH